MGLVDDIKKGAKGLEVDADKLVIEQTLNKLFYLPPAPKKELAMVKAQFKQKQGDRYGLHASAILTSEDKFCYREQVLSLFYKQAQGENVPVALKRIFEEGNFIHEKWQRLFLRGNLGEPLDMDHSNFNEYYDLSYTPDARLTIAKKKYVVEIKSVNTFQFKDLHDSHPSGTKQLKFYMWLTGIKQGFVLCDNKNTQDFKVFVAKLKPADVEPYIERLETIRKYKLRFKKHKKPPKRRCRNKDTKRALECNMRDACFNIGMGRVKL